VRDIVIRRNRNQDVTVALTTNSPRSSGGVPVLRITWKHGRSAPQSGAEDLGPQDSVFVEVDPPWTIVPTPFVERFNNMDPETSECRPITAAAYVEDWLSWASEVGVEEEQLQAAKAFIGEHGKTS